tara:strand:+ start:1778 stop:2296 length:519 start_codon:yes stop_codon:yes gene_type:complete
MAKSDAFFIRGKIVAATSDRYLETELDLGAFVNLGVSKSTLLRIHNVYWAIQDTSSPEKQPTATASGGDLNMALVLATQSATETPFLYEKSVISLENYFCVKDGANVTYRDTTSTAAPQHWDHGYLVGVDSIFMSSNVDQDTAATYTVSICMECTLENATQSNATALALSQQ